MPRLVNDRDLAPSDVAKLTSVDAVADFFAKLGYDTDARQELTAESIGLSGAAAEPIQSIELLAEDTDGFTRIVLVRLKSLTAKARADLAKVLGRTNADHLLILASDFSALEFVLLDKRRRDARGPGGTQRVQVVPLVFAIDRKSVSSKDLRTLRRFTFTQGMRDGLDQFDKLRATFEAAAFAEEHFSNRGLFADHYLIDRLRSDVAWKENPTTSFHAVRRLLDDAKSRWLDKGEEIVRKELFAPLFHELGFVAQPRKARPKEGDATPDYVLFDGDGKTPLAAAFAYAWDRWLDGPDHRLDQETPDENPGARVVSALGDDKFDWIVVTNGRQWRLYSRHAHSRATNFYEVDLAESLLLSGDSDPNEAFRYWWLFFRAAAFRKDEAAQEKRWLDRIAEESADYAKGLGERLKIRIFETIFPHLARGFLLDRRQRLGLKKAPTEDELRDVFQATLTLLYRLLFLLYAESRDLLPVREAPYFVASLKRLKQEVAEKGGVAESDREVRLEKAFAAKETSLYDRLAHLFAAIDQGDASLNVPTYNGGLFNTHPATEKAADPMQERERRIARFLTESKIPDRQLALALDLLSRDEDPKTHALVFIDYKSLAVRHLGSIYEGLLEFKLKTADEDLATKKDKGTEKFVPLASVKSGRGKTPGVVVSKGEVYLSNDKAERKASGSYYTPDPIVEYIVGQTVGPVLDEKLEGLRKRFRETRKTYDRELEKAKAYPVAKPEGGHWDPRDFAIEKLYAEHRPLVEELFEFRTLDPAMGSGHFLVEAVDFLTDRLLTFLSQFPINPVQAMLDRTRRSILAALEGQGVKVDPDKLTDVNLLKRHVLKRCIYGVDLNPMAVELAKVSLWLDAFTLGAPLSFLDHHLRCGNSLVGARMADLKAALSGRLYAFDLHEMEEAIREVIDLNEKSDATAEEVKESAALYVDARRRLSGYQIVLDLLTAGYFGIPEAPRILTHHGMEEVNLDSRSTFYANLDLANRRIAERSEELARSSELRFFHWEIEFPEAFYAFEDAQQRRMKRREEIVPGSAGFDAIVGNPPYDVIAEKELGVDVSELKGFIRSASVFAPANVGKQNLYKLFICRNVTAVRKEGRLGLIVPMALLGDEQSAGVRKLLSSHATLRAVEAFPQKDDASQRVFEDAKLSTCIFIAEKGERDVPLVVRVHRGREFDTASPTLSILRKELALYDPENQPVPVCSQADWDLATQILTSGRIARLGTLAEAFQGEVNETVSRAAGFISTEATDGPQVLRGSNICLYVVREASQGEAMYLRKDAFLRGKSEKTKAWHHGDRRVGLQESCPQNNFRRLIAAMIPANEFCNHKINYFPQHASRVPLELLLGVLNSKLADWFFRLGSTNAAVSHYQLYLLPFPRFSEHRDGMVSTQFKTLLKARELDHAYQLIGPMMATAPFSLTIADCIVEIVEAIIAEEGLRGEISRSERSSLSRYAEELQQLLDRVVFSLMGVSDDDAEALKARLSSML